MFKVCHKILSSLLLTKPSVHYIAPKVLNLYFRNAISSKYKMINLEHYDVITIDTSVEKDANNNNLFKLGLKLEQNNETKTIEVASFETKKELEDATIILRNKLYSPEKSILKGVIFTGVLLFALMLLLAIVQSILLSSNNNSYPPVASITTLTPQMLQQIQQRALAAAQNGQPIQPPIVGNPQAEAQAYENLQKAREQANKVIEEGTKPGTPAVVAPNNQSSVDIPQDPTVKGFMDNLKK